MTNPRISIILPIDNVEENDLSIPISSVNNQIGIDHHDVELLLVDNGAYKLERPEVFDLFRQVHLRYLETPRVMKRGSAIQYGIDKARGGYVLVIQPNHQLYQAATLQGYFTMSDAHPEATAINGLVTTQYFDAQRVAHYQVGRTSQNIAGRWIRREFLQQHQIRFEDEYGAYAQEYVSRLVSHLAPSAIDLDAEGVMVFTSRAMPNEDTLQAPINATWLTMMAGYFARLQQADKPTYMTEFARFVIRFYTQLKSVPVADRANLKHLLATLVGANAAAWAPALAYVQQVRTSDHSPAAPWNAEGAQFDHYLAGLDRYLSDNGLRREQAPSQTNVIS